MRVSNSCGITWAGLQYKQLPSQLQRYKVMVSADTTNPKDSELKYMYMRSNTSSLTPPSAAEVPPHFPHLPCRSTSVYFCAASTTHFTCNFPASDAFPLGTSGWGDHRATLVCIERDYWYDLGTISLHNFRYSMRSRACVLHLAMCWPNRIESVHGWMTIAASPWWPYHSGPIITFTN